MQKPSPDPAAGRVSLAARWRRLRAAWRTCNAATHHLLGYAVKAVLLAYFAFALLLLALRYLVLPHIDVYKGDIERLASKAVGNQVSIARIYASWRGLRPTLFLGDVALRDAQGRAVLSLPSVSATLSWWSLLAAEVRFESLEISRPELGVRREADGRLFVAGLLLDLRQGGDSGGAEWLLSQRQIVIRQGRVTWDDRLRAAPPLALDDVQLVLRNRWRGHQFALRATPPAGLGLPVDLRADFRHPPFAAKKSNVAQWKGELYADVQGADLAAWKTYVDYPFELSQGRGALRAWVTLDRAEAAAFTADVSLSDLTARLAPDLAPLELLRVSGRVAAQRDLAPAGPLGAGADGARGHRVQLDGFSLATRDGLTLPPTSLSERFVAAGRKRPEQTVVEAQVLDLATLAGLAARLPLGAGQRALLDDLAPRGLLRNLSAEWQGAYPALRSYRIRGEVEGLGLNAQPARPARPKTAGAPAQPARPAIPGVDHLTGLLDASDSGGSVRLHSAGLVLHLPGYLADPALPFERFNLQASWSFEPDDQLRLRIDALDFAQQGLSGSLSGRHTMPLKAAPGAGLGALDLNATLNGFDVKTVGRYLPLHTPAPLRHWLTGALEAGMANDVTIRLRGELAHFPFNGAGAAERARGEFRVAGRIDGGRLNYAPGEFAHDGKAPLWPQAEQIRGSFLVDRARLEIRADSARTGGVALSGVKAVIPDLGVDEQTLEIDGVGAGPLPAFLSYVEASPVMGWIDNFTDQTSATGNARLALKLRLPIAHMDQAKVLGSLQLQNNDIVLFHDLPPVQGASGRIEFNEKGVSLNGLAGTFLGGPVSIGGGSQRDDTIQVRLAGSVTAEAVRATYPSAAMQRLAGRFDGAARYSGLVTVSAHQVQVAIDSTLQGLSLDFPAPLQKAAADHLPLRFVLTAPTAPAPGPEHDEIRLALGSSIAAHYQRQRHGRAPWRVLRGGIGVNAPAPEPDAGVMVNVNLKSLNVDAWSEFGAAIAAPARPGAPAADEPDLAQYVVPDLFAARASELIAGGRKLENVVLGVSHQDNVWQANIDANQISGYLTWSEAANGGLGKVTARLSSLIIPESAAADVNQLLEGKGATKSIPGLDIVAERFQLFDKQLGRLDLQASNAMARGGQEWRINKLSLANPDGALSGTGKWAIRDGQSLTSLDFALDIVDAGKLLDRFGFADTLRNGKGKLSGALSWKGAPYAFDIPSLSGQIDMQVEKGQFLKQDPGAAKLLGVLSLQALPRLLKLDFHDVFSEGLAFDGISAHAQIARGVAKTDNLKMFGVAATVLMDGSADIANETANLHVVVIPEFNLGTGPLVYALAVNPVIGIGSFLAQLFLRAPVMKALTYQMRIAGPWKAPVVTKLESGKLVAAPAPPN